MTKEEGGRQNRHTQALNPFPGTILAFTIFSLHRIHETVEFDGITL